MERIGPTESDLLEEKVRKARAIFCDPLGETQEDWEKARDFLIEQGIDLSTILMHHHI